MLFQVILSIFALNARWKCNFVDKCQIFVDLVGDIQVTTDLLLKDVLYVASFRLISSPSVP